MIASGNKKANEAVSESLVCSRHHLFEPAASDDIQPEIQEATDYVEASGGGRLLLSSCRVERHNTSQFEIGDDVVLDLCGMKLCHISGTSIVTSKRYIHQAKVVAGSNEIFADPPLPCGACFGIPTTADYHVAQVLDDGNLLEPSPVDFEGIIERGPVNAGIENGTLDGKGTGNVLVSVFTGANWRLRSLSFLNAANNSFVFTQGSCRCEATDIESINPARHGAVLFRSTKDCRISRMSHYKKIGGGSAVVIDDRTTTAHPWDGICEGNKVSDISARLIGDTPGSIAVFVNGQRNTVDNITSIGFRVGTAFAYGVALQAPQRQSSHNTLTGLTYTANAQFPVGNAVLTQEGTEANSISTVTVDRGARGALIAGRRHSLSSISCSGLTTASIEFFAGSQECTASSVTTGGAPIINNGAPSNLVAAVT